MYATEVQWNIDSGAMFPQVPYGDNILIVEGPITMTEGTHTINYFDSYGDGWGSGGYWTVKADDGSIIAGGSVDGVVTGAGGSDQFCVASGGSTSGACSDYVDAAEASINVVITALTFANEITWDIDSGTTFGLNPAFADNSATSEVITLPAGDHIIHYFDSYGDGWHGGYWEITDCKGTTIAGGRTVGAVSGAGSETTFTVVPVANCPGAGAAPTPPAPPDDPCAGVTCPAASDPCMVAGTCSGGVCSMEVALTDGTSCDDNVMTTAQDSCVAGSCTGISSCGDGVTVDDATWAGSRYVPCPPAAACISTWLFVGPCLLTPCSSPGAWTCLRLCVPMPILGTAGITYTFSWTVSFRDDGFLTLLCRCEQGRNLHQRGTCKLRPCLERRQGARRSRVPSEVRDL